jgi:integrase
MRTNKLNRKLWQARKPQQWRTGPFAGDELRAMQNHAENDLLLFLLLRWTGLRTSDALMLRWEEVNFDRGQIEHVVSKEPKKLILPIHTELLAALEGEHQQRSPQPTEPVLLNSKGEHFTQFQVHGRIAALGKRAGVQHAHPRRFRYTFAIDRLLRGSDVYILAQLLGVSVRDVMNHFVSFIRKIRDHVRLFMDNGTGLE